ANPKSKIRNPKLTANRRIFTGVVSGIAHYGNCIGIPTIGGEIYFDESFEGNPLVNVFCRGVLRHEQVARGAASGVGNPVFYVGAETGRDGLAGAAFASRELTEESKQDRPAVQVGDPFKEKLLLEACLELLATDAVAGIQDMGAAGLTCSTCETASRGGTGVEIDLAKVPKREPGMTPYEILLSESQERMLIIAKRGRENGGREATEILAATTDCNSLYCRLDPREGGRIAVAEAARNLTCSGATPLAVTDNLNLGNPYKSENFSQLREAVEGIAETCRAFGTPVVGGNVSLYNESPAGVVDPTP